MSSRHRHHATEGMTTNCASSPTRISFGCIITGLKSEGFRVNPIPNITTPSIGVTAEVDTHKNDVGMNNANAATPTTSSVICAAIHAERLYSLFSRFMFISFLKTQSRRDAKIIFIEHGMSKKNESFRLFCVFGVQN